MTDPVYFLLCGICVAAVLLGINLMSKVKTAVLGNALSAAAMIMAMTLTVIRYGITSHISLYVALAIGAVIGVIGAAKAKMISMPQIIALLNGLGGAASALVAGVTAINGPVSLFDAATAGLALAVGALTFTGSLIAAGKLARILDSRPKTLPHHAAIMGLLAALCVAGIVLQTVHSSIWAIPVAVLSLAIGVVFVIRVGGADMPITILCSMLSPVWQAALPVWPLTSRCWWSSAVSSVLPV